MIPAAVAAHAIGEQLLGLADPRGHIRQHAVAGASRFRPSRHVAVDSTQLNVPLVHAHP